MIAGIPFEEYCGFFTHAQSAGDLLRQRGYLGDPVFSGQFRPLTLLDNGAVLSQSLVIPRLYGTAIWLFLASVGNMVVD